MLLGGVVGTITWIIISGLTHFNLDRALNFPLMRSSFLKIFPGIRFGDADRHLTTEATTTSASSEMKSRNPRKTSASASALGRSGRLLVHRDEPQHLGWCGRRCCNPAQENNKLYVFHFMQRIYGSWAANLATGLVMWTAFASVFVGARLFPVPYAAALDGNYFRAFSDSPEYRFPNVSAGIRRCSHSLLLSITGRRYRSARSNSHYASVLSAGNWTDRAAHPSPDLPRPFRMWLYPFLRCSLLSVHLRTNLAQIHKQINCLVVQS